MQAAESTNIRVAGVDYPMAWSFSVYKKFKQLSGLDYNYLCTKVFNAINELQFSLGKPPIYYADLKGADASDNSVFYTIEEFEKAKEVYTLTFDMEFTKRVLGVFDMEVASKLFYVAANELNSKVTLEEMEENLFIEGVRSTETKSGYQYLLFEYISWVVTLSGGSDSDEKKHSKGSLLKKLISSLTT